MSETKEETKEPTSEYRLLTGVHVMNRQTYRSGVGGQDVLDLTEDRAKGMGDRVRKVSDEKKGSVKESGKESDLKEPVDLKPAGGKEKDLKVIGK